MLGWDKLREERSARMHAMNIGGPNLSAMSTNWGRPGRFRRLSRSWGQMRSTSRVWDELTDAQRNFQARKMAIHAAMIDRMDREIGRVLDQLRAMGAMDNTLILFLSDNGARRGNDDPRRRAQPGGAIWK